jgi:small subunit ribosomal protein S20
MAKRTASAKKQARSGVRRAARNRAMRSEVKTMVVKARRALGEGPVGESERYATATEALRALDRAAAKGVLHPNNAARRKARLARQLAKLALSAPPAPAPASKGKGRGKAAAAAAAAPAPASSSAKKK